MIIWLANSISNVRGVDAVHGAIQRVKVKYGWFYPKVITYCKHSYHIPSDEYVSKGDTNLTDNSKFNQITPLASKNTNQMVFYEKRIF